MKRLSLYITLLTIALCAYVSVSFAATSTPSSTVPVVGSAVWENAGNLVFDYELGVPGSNEVSINGNTLDFAGTFWSENVGWCTFNGLGINGSKLTGTWNIKPMTGFAWCENAGWISFNPRNTIDTVTYANSDAFFDTAAGLFHGFAWSENLGWIDMTGLITDITPPDLNANFKPFSASGSKIFTLNDPSPAVPTGAGYSFEVENWNNTSTTLTGSTSPIFTHDFRQAKQYYLKITDPFGNISEGNIQVVADVPSDILNTTYQIPSASPSSYTSTFTGSRVADNTDVHSMLVKLRDQYGNPVINEPGIKTVNVRVAFSNNVDKDQSLTIGWVIGDAIRFPGTSFAGLTYASGTIGIASNTSGDYPLDISSYAPTKVGYSFTNPNDIAPQKLSYEVVPLSGNSGIGEVSETDKLSEIGTWKLKFSPALYVGNVTNTDNWTIRTGYKTDFAASLLTGTTVSLTNPAIAHILDIDSNILISYQNPSNVTGGSESCNGYMKTMVTFSWVYTSTSTGCSRPDSSNILIIPSSLGGVMGFSWKPTIIYAAPSNSLVGYKSEISYKNGWVDVRYPSYTRSNSVASGNGVGPSVPTTGTGVGIINQSVKILGMATGRNTIDVLQGNNTNKVGTLTRVDIKNTIHKNVETMTKWGVPASAKYKVYTGDQTFAGWPDTTIDTLIIKWGDLTITGDMPIASKIRGIIVLKDDAGNGGRIYIKGNVSNVAAVVYADKGIVSGVPGTYYSDTQSATGQLLLEGSMISDNTIGGASMTPLKCPYGAGVCDDQEAKRYDLNYFRFYSGTGASSPGAVSSAIMPASGIGYPFVIKYDNRLQTSPPPGFTIN